ncbi:uncharacterized protein EV154DRAFT_44890 [Mucor mucedo]|uniref:uncharacterized protein n=1 Tax=Mucor mucedo TaxID=29922 RepID=UPI00221E6E2C|nr:uncharacterized protein EV154DRAFT_44890 [Mucor mucedo]KAI7880812.1 hypothetical protein EV154DRAFT_44890 [Mucor mucedo]
MLYTVACEVFIVRFLLFFFFWLKIKVVQMSEFDHVIKALTVILLRVSLSVVKVWLLHTTDFSHSFSSFFFFFY